MVRLLRHDDTVHREEDGAVRFEDPASIFRSRNASTSHWPIRAWLSFLQRGGGVNKRFQYCLNPCLTWTFSKHSSIAGTFRRYSRWSYMARQRTVATRLHRVHQSRWEGTLTTCTPSSRVDWFRQEEVSKGTGSPCFFTAVQNQDLEEVQYDLDKPRIAVYCHTWKIHQTTLFWCNLKGAQRRGLQFNQTRSHAIALFNTVPAICIEKVENMMTGEDSNCRVHQSPRLPRVVLTPNLHHGRQDLSNPEARTSGRPSKRTKREVRGNSSLAFRGHSSQASRRKSQSEVEETRRFRKLRKRRQWQSWPHNLHTSTNYLLHMDKVFPIVRQRYGLSPMDQMKDLDENTAIWGKFMFVTLQAGSSSW